MKAVTVVFSLVVASSMGEAPYPPARPAQEAPYPPSGTKPDGPQLMLPGEYGPPPTNEYGPPPTNEYGPPPTNEYGPPPTNEYGPSSGNNDTAPESSSQPPRGDSVDAANARLMEKLQQTPGSERAVYHIYLPDGRLQRVRYTSAPLQQFQAGNQKEFVDEDRNSYYVNVQQNRLKTNQKQQVEQAGYLPPSSEKKEEIKLASVHFMDVEPISGPIYNIDKKQLSRVLRRTQ